MLASNEIYLGDCLEVMKQIDDKSIDMILCDLPYGMTDCKWDKVIDLSLLWDEYKRIIKEGGAIVLTACNPFAARLIMSNPKWFRHEWIWQKNNHSNAFNAKVAPLRVHELILVFGNKKVSYNPQGLIEVNKTTRQGRLSDNVRRGRESHNNTFFQKNTNYPKSIQCFKSETRLHSTQKPLALFEYLVKTYSKENDVVLDNCAGSGTTAIAAINANRRYILIEKEEKYYDLCKKRIEAIKGE